jgi:hypothetical protein
MERDEQPALGEFFFLDSSGFEFYGRLLTCYVVDRFGEGRCGGFFHTDSTPGR